MVGVVVLWVAVGSFERVGASDSVGSVTGELEVVGSTVETRVGTGFAVFWGMLPG